MTDDSIDSTTKVNTYIIRCGDTIDVFSNITQTVSIRIAGQDAVSIAPRDIPTLCKLLKLAAEDCDTRDVKAKVSE